MPIGKIGQRRQVVIPKEICDELDLQVGDFVEVRQEKARSSYNRRSLWMLMTC